MIWKAAVSQVEIVLCSRFHSWEKEKCFWMNSRHNDSNRTSKLSNSWPVFFGSDSLWPRMSRAPFEDSKTSGQRLEKLKSNLARLNIKLIWVQIQFKRSEHRPNLWEERHARLPDWIAKRREMWEAGWETQHSFTFSTPSSNAPSCGPTSARSCCNLTFFERNADEVFLTTSKRSTCFEYYSPR